MDLLKDVIRAMCPEVQRDRACSNEEQRQECELRDLQRAQKLESNRYRNTTCIVRKDDWNGGERGFCKAPGPLAENRLSQIPPLRRRRALKSVPTR